MQRLAGKASLTEELVVAQNGDDRFLALVGGHREFHLALMEIEHGIRRVSLHEDHAVRAVFQNAFPARDSCQEYWPIDGRRLPVGWRKCRLAFAIGPDILRRALLWRHNNPSFLLAEGESVVIQDGNCTQTYQLGFLIPNSNCPLAEMLAFGEGIVCRPSNTGLKC